MTDYNLPFSGNEVRDGLTRVVSPDLSPQSPSTKMVTSEGIKAALDTKVEGSLATNLNTPNNTSVPTTQAIVDYVGPGYNLARFTATDGNVTRNGTGTFNLNTLSEASDPQNFASTNGTTITLAANGIYTILFSGLYVGSQGFASNWYFRGLTWTANHHNTVENPQIRIANRPNNTGSPPDDQYKRISLNRCINTYDTSRESFARIDLNYSYSNSSYTFTVFWKEVTVTIIKHL